MLRDEEDTNHESDWESSRSEDIVTQSRLCRLYNESWSFVWDNRQVLRLVPLVIARIIMHKGNDNDH